MIACFDCRNLTDFVQVSARGDRRDVDNSTNGFVPETWAAADDRPPGVYCRRCNAPIDADPVDLGLGDDRIDFVSPADFDAESAAAEIQTLRPDAEWHRIELPERPPTFRALTANLHPGVHEALSRTGRDRLFTHQAAAIDAAIAGRNVVQATSAGSGKSLGFTVPVLDALARDPAATALFLFPMRALANDQVEALARLGTVADPWSNDSCFSLELGSGAETIGVGRHDGSTKEHERAEIRRSARIVVSTPDSLHHAILRYGRHTYKDKTSWRRFVRGLRYVVLDEIHAYQGVFGSNVGNVLRRLRRLADVEGASPQFLAASATIGNPVELARRLSGLDEFELVDDDGSHRRRRIVLVCNPPLRREHESEEESDGEPEEGTAPADGEAGRLAPQTVAIELAAAGALASSAHAPVRTIGFCRSRNEVFGLTKRLQARLKDLKRSDLGSAVAPYAATFLATDRVEAEGRLRDGSTLAVISTNALELGIDIPDLSIALLVGYPGQIASFRQRAGRVGRGGEGLVVLIVGDDPLQQFVARDPGTLERLLDGRPEEVVINPEAPQIVRRYGLAPAQEELGGIGFEDASYFGTEVTRLLDTAVGPPAAEVDGRPIWRIPLPDEPYADLRNFGSGTSYTVISQTGRDRTPVGVIGADVAPRDCFVPAIWNGPDGDLYEVTGFDLAEHEIYCRPVEVAHLTRGVTVDRVTVLTEQADGTSIGPAVLGFGALEISRMVHSYKELPFSGRERSLSVERGWPAHDFHTTGLHLELPPDELASLEDPAGSVRAVEHLILSLAPTVVACDPYDLEAASDNGTVYVYDSFGGDLGVSRPVFERFPEVAQRALETVEGCDCSEGCPSCVMLARRPDGNRELFKAGAIQLLRPLVD